MTVDRRFERRLSCTGCGATITVGGYIDDLDPDTFRGVVCGCRKPKPEPAPATATRRLAAAMERAHAAASGVGIPY